MNVTGPCAVVWLAPRVGAHGQQSVCSNGRVFYNLCKPIAHVQRRIDLTGIRE